MLYYTDSVCCNIRDESAILHRVTPQYYILYKSAVLYRVTAVLYWVRHVNYCHDRTVGSDKVQSEDHLASSHKDVVVAGWFRHWTRDLGVEVSNPISDSNILQLSSLTPFKDCGLGV